MNEVNISDINKPVGAFARLPEMEKAPEVVKRVLSCNFADSKDVKEMTREEFIAPLRRHPYDKTSLEYKIASKTFRIRCNKQRFTGKFRKNYEMKVRLNNCIQKRNKELKMLGRLDQERYKFVKEYLQIDHEPFPLGEGHQKVTRKGELRRLTEEYKNKIIEEKMEAYHEELKAQQKDFEIEKKETEEWIAKEIEALKLTEGELKQLDFKGIYG